MKRKLLRLLPVAAVLLTASCTDNQYDLSDIDTTSQFEVNNLVIPLNMSPIKLDNIIKEGGNIRKDKGDYYFEKVGEKKMKPDGSEYEDFCFKSDDVNVEEITISKPEPIPQEVTVNISLSQDIQDAIINNNAADISINDIIGDPELSAKIGLNNNTPIYSVNIENTKDFVLTAENIDSRITKLNKLGIEESLNIDVQLGKLMELVDIVKIQKLNIDLPCGMIIDGIDDNIAPDNINKNKYNYESATGVLKVVNDDGLFRIINGDMKIKVKISGLEYKTMKGNGPELFDATTHEFNYNKTCGVRGYAEVVAGDLNTNVTLNKINEFGNTKYKFNVGFSNDITVKSFSGGINYVIDPIEIDPVKIDDLPELLDQTGTSLEVENPQLYLQITNPFNKNDITAQASLSITGNKNFTKDLTFNEENNKKLLSPLDKEEERIKGKEDYSWEEFPGMRDLLKGDENSEESNRIPKTLYIKVINPVLNADNVKDFELGIPHSGITGNWEFYAKLSLTNNTKIVYQKVWDDWGSEDLDGLTVEKATAKFKVKKDIALDAEKIRFTLLGKDNKELWGETSLTKAEQDVTIEMKGGPVSNIYGGKLEVTLKGKNQSINAEKTIEISNLSLTVSGNYNREF